MYILIILLIVFLSFCALTLVSIFFQLQNIQKSINSLNWPQTVRSDTFSIGLNPNVMSMYNPEDY